ncbi:MULTISPECIES: hypothetical protein [unclassified Haladaptatus]|uniref:hypothetical protein n=1 Tax=unclassified Haladaptatus TaxID=2622732 RepID=UPI0023E86EAF|nr:MULTISPECIES: hypothetical protein [unclassified Haladaptatus]
MSERRHSLALHALDDAAGTSSDAYACFVDYCGSDGTLLARTAADAEHNHWGVYTRKHPLGNPSGKRVKRLSMSGGMADTIARFMSPENVRLWVDAEEQPILDLRSRRAGERVVIYVDSDRESLRINDLGRKKELLEISLGDDPCIDFKGLPVEGLNLEGYVPKERYDALEARVAELEKRLG